MANKKKTNKAKVRSKNKRIAMLSALLVVCGASIVLLNIGYMGEMKAREAAQQEFINKEAAADTDTQSEAVQEEIKVSADTSSAADGETVALEVKAADESIAVQSQQQDTASSPAAAQGDIAAMVDKMTLHQKVCQMCIVTPEGLTGYDLVTQAGDATKSALEQYPVGGLIYFSQNFEDVAQTKEMISGVQQYNTAVSEIPLFISVDEEGGIVARCADELGTTEFEPMYEYRSKGTDTAYNNAKTIASDIKALGFNLDFAPVADTWSNPDNTVIGTRAYSDDFGQTAELVASAVKGFSDGGVACTLKHFPGHGDTAEDSHYGTATSAKTLEQLDKEEYQAFRSGIAAGADMVMVGHINMTNVDNIPASLSPTMINGELRGKLDFDGLVITDSLMMGAVTDNYSAEEAAVKVVEAGGDILLMPADLSAAVDGLETAVKNGEISEQRINESVARILKVKKNRGILK